MTTDAPRSGAPHRSPTSPAGELPRCKCGHDRTHHMVSAVGNFSPWAWALLVFGISVRPYEVEYRCRKCDRVIERTSDPEACRKAL